MIAAKFYDEKGNVCLMLVLEPGNLEKLKTGLPIHKWLNELLPELAPKIELLLAYSPDTVWVAEQMKGCENDGMKLVELIAASLTRPPVVKRDRTAEEMKRVF